MVLDGLSDSSLEASIQAWRLRAWSSRFKAWKLRFKPGSSDSSLEAQIQVWRLRFKPGGFDSSLEAQIQENHTKTILLDSISNGFGWPFHLVKPGS